MKTLKSWLIAIAIFMLFFLIIALNTNCSMQPLSYTGTNYIITENNCTNS